MKSVRGGKRAARRPRTRERRRRRVRIGAPDASLTPCAGLAAVSETDRALGLVTRLDARIPSIKRRDRGLSAGQLLVAMSAWLQEITGIDRGNGRGRRTITRLRSELINIPARVIHPGRTTVLRLPPGPNLLTTVLPRLQALPSG